jgi:hypothetical protein
VIFGVFFGALHAASFVVLSLDERKVHFSGCAWHVAPTLNT